MASNNLEVARYVDAKQNGKHLVREEEDKAINAASTNHTWHDLKNLVAQFESMATNLFMD